MIANAQGSTNATNLIKQAAPGGGATAEIEPGEFILLFVCPATATMLSDCQPFEAVPVRPQ
jgi:hypothetical protein